MRKVFQVIAIGIAAYNLYVMVNDFLETPAGKRVKGKVEPWLEDAGKQAKEFVDKVYIPSRDEIKAKIENIPSKTL